MKKTVRTLTLLTIFGLAFPSYSVTISDRTWHSFTGLGAIGGGILGTLTYKKLRGTKESAPAKQESQNEQSHENQPKKRSYAQAVKDFLPWVWATAIGAAAGGIGLNRLLAGFSQSSQDEKRRLNAIEVEQAHLAQIRANEGIIQQNLELATELIHSVNNEHRLETFITRGLDGETASQSARALFAPYPLVYGVQHMTRAEEKLQNARNQCNNALQLANGREEIVQVCNNSLLQIEQLTQAAQDYRRELQEQPEYHGQVAAETAARLERERIETENRRIRVAQEEAQLERERRQKEDQRHRDQERRHQEEMLRLQRRQTTVVIQTPPAVQPVVYAPSHSVPAPAPTIVMQTPPPATYPTSQAKPLYNALDHQKPSKPVSAPKANAPKAKPSSGSSSSNSSSLSSLGRLDNPPLAGTAVRPQMNDLLNKMKNVKK